MKKQKNQEKITFIQKMKSFFKKIKKPMFDQDRLISYKQNFTGQSFQWVKTDRPELIGKVVRCRDVEPFGNMIMAVFDDGSRLDASKINTHMLMLHGDMKPLSKDEVESIYGARNQIKQPQPTSEPAQKPQPQVTVSSKSEPAPSQNKEVRPNMFEMFNSDTISLPLSLNIKLPNKKLLKMMYDSSENKEKFISELSEYINSMINKEVISESVKGMLGAPKKKQETHSPVKFTEVDGD